MRFLQGITDLERIIREEVFYVDKTSFIEKIENDSPYLMFIRPRRFGKSLFVNTLCRYYDIIGKDRFQDIFGKLYAGTHPTPERSSYLILYFNFSMVDTSGSEENIQRSFQFHCSGQIQNFLFKYRQLLPIGTEAAVREATSASDKLAILVQNAYENALPIYVVIDEYDNFANNILAGYNGQEKYARLTHGTGFFRSFFTFLKGCTGNDNFGAVRRIFMTGVSPLVLDDVTSGFNIAKNISCQLEYNGLLGFSEDDVRHALESIQASGPIEGTVESHLALMRDYYNNYCFNVDINGDRMFNTNMCITYLDTLASTRHTPHQLIDANTRTDYNKLKHLIIINNKLNCNFNVLCNLAVNERIEARLIERFPLEELKHADQFISLLFYMGIITIDKPYRGQMMFRIPNRTVKTIICSYIEESMERVGFSLSGTEKMREATDAMAYEGDWRAMIDYIHNGIITSTSIRDFIEGEKCIQIAHLVAMWPITCYLPRTEREAQKGYLDLILVPNHLQNVDVPYTYVLEFKYLKEEASQADLQKAIADARAQLKQYVSDRQLLSECSGTILTTLAVIYRKWDIAYCEAIDTLQL